MDTDLLQKASSLQAIFEPTSAVRTVTDLIDELRLEMEGKMELLSQTFLPCEATTVNQLHTDIGHLKSRIRKLEKRLTVEPVPSSVSTSALAAYPYLGLDPLGWRDTQGFPSLVVFPIFERSAGYFAIGSEGVESVLPAEFAGCYEDVIKRLRDELALRLGHRPPPRGQVNDKERKALSLRCRFEGFIPPETRTKILDAKAVFGENMFLIAEPAEPLEIIEWTMPASNKIDPLVVGWHPLYPSRLWLVDMFDVTPLETAITLTARR